MSRSAARPKAGERRLEPIRRVRPAEEAAPEAPRSPPPSGSAFTALQMPNIVALLADAALGVAAVEADPRPPAGASRPAMVRISVVLPAPFGPSSSSASPALDGERQPGEQRAPAAD